MLSKIQQRFAKSGKYYYSQLLTHVPHFFELLGLQDSNLQISNLEENFELGAMQKHASLIDLENFKMLLKDAKIIFGNKNRSRYSQEQAH